MKHIKIIVGFSLLMNFLQCKAQQIYSLNTNYETIPNYSYLKDIDNELQAFTGTYKSNYQGNEITLFITKVDHELEVRAKKSYYTDILVVKYIIKNPSGTVLQDTQNSTSMKNVIRSMGTMAEFNAVGFHYTGTNCNVGNGIIYLRKIDSNQIYWDYRPNSMILDQQNCPGNQDTKVYLPATKDLIFTKQ
ncbi:MAG: hypothetical protein LBE92_02400 [Chryseobacterium sp.]|jgi:hypothetical protein|uniref:DUF6705 family protein n=1 Tax=Chryseobacterium sp. TaxID=1871047 RepID=UPI00281D4939|nr:DUF6705 family protein [Chryseobacterium sp.]MDR2234951.1 hypothetical protein [Chryseobacterium sp.]